MEQTLKENSNRGRVRQATRQYTFTVCNNLKKVIAAYFLWLAGYGLLYSWIEKISFFDSIWQGIVTASTVGYGDISPATNEGKVLTGFFILSTVYVFTALIIAHILMSFIEDRDAFTHEEQEELFARQRQMFSRLEQLAERVEQNLFTHDEQEAFFARQQMMIDELRGMVERNERNRFTHEEQEALKAQIDGLTASVDNIVQQWQQHGFTDDEQNRVMGALDELLSRTEPQHSS